MIDFRLNDENDLDFQNGDLQMIDDTEEVIQSVQTLVSTRLGEFFGAPEMGLDYTDILGKNFNEQYAMSDIVDAVNQDSRVTAVTEVAFQKEGRNLNCFVTFEIDDSIEAKVEVVLDD